MRFSSLNSTVLKWQYVVVVVLVCTTCMEIAQADERYEGTMAASPSDQSRTTTTTTDAMGHSNNSHSSSRQLSGFGSGFINVFYRLFFWWRNDDNSNSRCQCIVPFEEDLCASGATAMCVAGLTENLVTDSIQERLLFRGCEALLSAMEFLNCRRDRWYLSFLPNRGTSDRPGAKSCYNRDGFIRILEPSRGNCDANSCCQVELCPLERYMHFTMLSNGVDVSDDNEGCESSLDVYGGEVDANCSSVTDGLSNTGIVCSNATVTGAGYCDVTLAATNDAIDVVREAQHAFRPVAGTTITFNGANGKQYSFTALEGMASIGYGDEFTSGPGIVDVTYESLQEKGCLNGEKAIHLMGHSLGAFLVSALAIQIGALNPNVEVQLTTVGEPAVLVEPLKGAAAELPCWNNKMSYINGMVIPRSGAIDAIGVRSYGVYQGYDVVPQLSPGGYHFAGKNTRVFTCEVLTGDGTLRYFLGPEGCANERLDVLNRMPAFPHEGGLDSDTDLAGKLNRILSLADPFNFLSRFTKLRRSLSVVLAATDENLRQDMMLLPDLHAMRRYLQFFNRLTHYGEVCEATDFFVRNALIDTC